MHCSLCHVAQGRPAPGPKEVLRALSIITQGGHVHFSAQKGVDEVIAPEPVPKRTGWALYSMSLDLRLMVGNLPGLFLT